jgi:polyhydroxyalkanoate synthase
VSGDLTAEAGDWALLAATQEESWWSEFASWLVERSGEEKSAPADLGNERFQPIEDGPRSYVLDT